ncbi:MAG: alpha-galactosidase [Planctomycetia bacterium]|nr:alpha-galactosidase [Planctomycetia bacterium]
MPRSFFPTSKAFVRLLRVGLYVVTVYSALQFGARGQDATSESALERLPDAFRVSIDAVVRRGLTDAHALPLQTQSFTSRLTFPTATDDPFPRDPVATQRRVALDPSTKIKYAVETTRYQSYPVVENLVWLENAGEERSAVITDFQALDIMLPVGESARLTYGFGESPDPQQNYRLVSEQTPLGQEYVFTPRESYPSYGAFPYFQIDGTSRRYILAIGWTGQWRATFVRTEEGVRVQAGQENVELFLNPGERIRSPRITLFELPVKADATNLWRDWIRRYTLPRQGEKTIRPKFVLDVFYQGELYDKLTAQEQIDTIEGLNALLQQMSAKDGVNYTCDGLWVDAGWYLRADSPNTCVGRWFGVGDWTPDPERFPNGFAPAVDKLKEYNPQGDFVLWYEPERIHRSQLNNLKDYVVPNCEAIESYRMDLTKPETVAYLSQTIGDSLVANKVGIYRQDSNGAGPQVFLESLERNDPRFIGRRGYAENLYVRGLYDYWNRLKMKLPELVYDSCASGGRRNDLEMLRFGAVPLHYSDVGYFDFLEKQHMHDTLDRWFIYYKNIDAHDYDYQKNEYDMYKSTIDMAPFYTIRPMILSHPSRVNRHYIERYFAIRDLMVDGDYYALCDNQAHGEWSIRQFDDSRERNADGVAVTSAQDACARYLTGAAPTSIHQYGCVLCVRNAGGNEETKQVKLQGLAPSARYCVENLDDPEHKSVVTSGETLMRDGLTVKLPENGAAIYRYGIITASAQ